MSSKQSRMAEKLSRIVSGNYRPRDERYVHTYTRICICMCVCVCVCVNIGLYICMHYVCVCRMGSILEWFWNKGFTNHDFWCDAQHGVDCHLMTVRMIVCCVCMYMSTN